MFSQLTYFFELPIADEEIVPDETSWGWGGRSACCGCNCCEIAVELSRSMPPPKYAEWRRLDWRRGNDLDVSVATAASWSEMVLPPLPPPPPPQFLFDDDSPPCRIWLPAPTTPSQGCSFSDLWVGVVCLFKFLNISRASFPSPCRLATKMNKPTRSIYLMRMNIIKIRFTNLE